MNLEMAGWVIVNTVMNLRDSNNENFFLTGDRTLAP